MNRNGVACLGGFISRPEEAGHIRFSSAEAGMPFVASESESAILGCVG
jgi:hypothetical protein